MSGSVCVCLMASYSHYKGICSQHFLAAAKAKLQHAGMTTDQWLTPNPHHYGRMHVSHVRLKGVCWPSSRNECRSMTPYFNFIQHLTLLQLDPLSRSFSAPSWQMITGIFGAAYDLCQSARALAPMWRPALISCKPDTSATASLSTGPAPRSIF